MANQFVSEIIARAKEEATKKVAAGEKVKKNIPRGMFTFTEKSPVASVFFLVFIRTILYAFVDVDVCVVTSLGVRLFSLLLLFSL